MRKISTGIAVLFAAGIHSSPAETLITAQDYAVDSDVVLESALKEIKSAPRDTVNVVGDGLKYVADETVTAAKGVAAAFKSDPVEKAERAGIVETAKAWYTADDIVFRSYKVSSSVAEELLQGMDVVEGAPVDVSGFFGGMKFPKGTSAVLRPEFNKLFIRQTMENILTIEDVLAEQHNAQRELMGHQVEIQTKFIEVSQKTLNDLGFNWTFGSKYGGSAHLFENLYLPANQDLFSAGLRTAATALNSGVTPDTLTVAKTAGSLRWDLVIRALEQSDDSDVLSTPSVVTRDGNTATIMVGEDRMVPKRFGINSANTSIYVEHSDWDNELVGVQLEVTPELRQGDLIDLELKPRVMDLIGYDDYQVSPDNATMILWQGQPYVNVGPRGRFPVLTQLADGTMSTVGILYSNVLNAVNFTDANAASTDVNDTTAYKYNGYTYSIPSQAYYAQDRMPMHDTEGVAVPSLHGQLPYFRIREMETQVTVADGSTVGMGGLIYDKLETYRDKVPVLGSIPFIGRLFRSEGEKSIKRNLMIFVTATQVDVNGRRASDLALKK